MSTVQPVSPPPGSRFGISRRTWRVAGIGFGIGLLLFVLLWLDVRTDSEFYRAEGQGRSVDGQVFEPLPAPMADGQGSASGLTEAAEEARRNPRPAPPPAAAPPEVANPVERAAGTEPPPGERPSPRPNAPKTLPVPLSRPAPSYPAEALRSNETGTVLLTITVDEEGTPIEVKIKQSSRSRALDRAAAQAARRWTFRPAEQDGRPVTADIDVPIAFSLEGR